MPARECEQGFTCPEGRAEKVCERVLDIWDAAETCADPWFAVCVDRPPYETAFRDVHYCIPQSRAWRWFELGGAICLAVIIGLFGGYALIRNRVRKNKLGLYED